MKKILTGIIGLLILTPGVKADTTIINIENQLPGDGYCSLSGCDKTYEQAKEDILNYYIKNYKENYPYYFLAYTYAQSNKLILGYSDTPAYEFTAHLTNYSVRLTSDNSGGIIHTFYDNSFVSTSATFKSHETDTATDKNYYALIDSNIEFTLSGNNYEFQDFYKDNITLNIGDKLPLYKNMINYGSWASYVDGNNSKYTEVNLDNYEYVILNLKDYSKKEAFSSTLSVKGMIGVTPVYDYGRVEKTDITDRCNISYEDFTLYNLYILKNDLTNNVVYYVKSCEEGSSFKFDNTIFEITYITAENVDNPVVTIGGKEYVTIPFKELNNSANENENNNYIPGESKNFLTGLLDNFDDFSEGIWSAITSFMGLATKFFNTLPPEFRALSVSAFTTLIIIAIIKFIRG